MLRRLLWGGTLTLAASCALEVDPGTGPVALVDFSRAETQSVRPARTVRVSALGTAITGASVLGYDAVGALVERRTTDNTGLALLLDPQVRRVKVVAPDFPVRVVRTADDDGQDVELSVELGVGLAAAGEAVVFRARELESGVVVVPEASWTTMANLEPPEGEAALALEPPRAGGLLDLVPPGTRPAVPEDSVVERQSSAGPYLEARYTGALQRRSLGAAYDVALIGSLVASISHADGRNLPVRIVAGGTQLTDGHIGATAPGGAYVNAVPSVEQAFTDIADHPLAARIAMAKGLGFASGYPDGAFRPNAELTRAEAAALFVAALEVPRRASASSSFADVQPSDWFAEAVEAARAAELLRGYPDGTFRPAAPLKRSELAALIAASGALPTLLPDGRFEDVRADHWAAAALTTAHAYCRALDAADGHMRPEANATRAEAVAALARLAECGSMPE